MTLTSILLLVNAAILLFVEFRLRVFTREMAANPSASLPGFMTPNQARSLIFDKGDLLIVTTEQHLNRVQVAAMREWAEAFTAAHGIKVVVLGGGLKPEMLLRATAPNAPGAGDGDGNDADLNPSEAEDLQRARLIDEIDARLSARIAARPRERRPGSDGHPPAHP